MVKKKKKRNILDLPEDLVVEILSRVPAASLARLPSTSKRWNALFKEGSFVKKHSANAPRQLHLFLMLLNSRLYSVSIDLHGVRNNNNVAPSAKVTESWGVSVKGNTYWLHETLDGKDFELLRFDFSTERFQTLPLPQPLPHCARDLSLVREDQLCLLTHPDENPLDLHVWVTAKIESNGVISWSKVLTAKTNSKLSGRMSFLADHKIKILVGCGVSKDIFLRSVRENTYIRIQWYHLCEESEFPIFFNYVPSLVQIQ
ncbi:hypothetical protein CARUB_v10014445mg [Capsella rubella]|uniref:F-box domain-containing protein n=1 Tax=Capsella rubella TaxID=81985 RepID=R0I4L2_9BRAS|nr:hypothetical protein CARUB_v10014445mg [Capsella rubella]